MRGTRVLVTLGGPAAAAAAAADAKGVCNSFITVVVVVALCACVVFLCACAAFLLCFV